MALHCYAACRPNSVVPEGPGVAGGIVELVADGPVAALVSQLPEGHEPATRQTLEAHADVVAAAFAEAAVVPFRFPTTALSAGTVVSRLLRPRRELLHQILAHLQDREEVRVRVTYDEDAAVAEALDADPGLRRLCRRRGAALQLGEGVLTALRERATRDAAAALDLLRRAGEVEVDRAGGERDVLVASALVPSRHTGGVAEVLEQWAATRPPVRLRVAGPLPPYSFAHTESHR